MTDLPCCRLCKHTPAITMEIVTCSNQNCQISSMLFNIKTWRRLMYVPEKKTATLGMTLLGEGFIKGYNAAIDKLEKGGV